MFWSTKYIAAKRIFCGIGLMLALTSSGFCQSFFEDMAKVKEYFNGPSPMRVTVDVKYFRNENDVASALTKKGLVKKNGTDQYYSLFDGKEYLINKKYTLLVDRSKKLIVLKDSKRGARTSSELSFPEIGKEQESKYNITRIQKDDRIVYGLTSRQNPKDRLRVELGLDGQHLLKMVYFGGNSYARTEISYLYPPGEVTFTPDEFSETRYVTKSQQTFVLSKSYAGYELNNQTR